MKKYKYFLIIVIVIMIIPFIIKIFKKSHTVEYKKNNYKIKETFYIRNNYHYYDFIISNKKQTYSYTINKKVNKNKKIVKKVNEYKKGNIKCIIPIYKGKTKPNTYCLKDNNQVSNYYLKDNKNYQDILKQAKKYKIKTLSSSSQKTKYKKLKVYKNNISNNNAFIIWYYKGIYILKNDELNTQKFLDYDIYDNVLSVTNSRYYVLFDNSSVNGIEKVHYYDLKKDKYKTFKLKEKLSKDSYINGVCNDLIYITDNRKKLEYTINIKKKKIEVVGKEELGYVKYTNGKKSILTKSDFFMKPQYFDNEIIKNKKISSEDIIEEGSYSYYLENDTFYKKMKKGNKILLFSLDNISKWYIYNGNIIIIKDDELYIYNDETGLNIIAEYNELKYNKENIVEFWSK